MPFGGISAGSVFVKLGADLDRHGFDQFEKEHTKAAKAKDIHARLGGNFEPREFRAYEQQLDKVQKRVAKRDAFKAVLGGDYNAQAFRAYERDLAKAERDTVKAQGRMRTAFGSVWGKGGAAFAAAGGAYAVVSAVKSVTTAYGEAEASQKRVETAVKNAGVTYQDHAKHIDNVIQKQSKLAAFDDEDLADSFGKIIGATKDVNEALRLNGLAADVARGRQISLEAANRLVIRAYQGNTGALKRLGIDLDPVTKAQDKLKVSTKKATDEQKKAAKAADDAASSQKAVAKLQQQFGGQAEQYGKTQSGAIDRLSVAWENLREKIGEKLAPVLTDVFGKMADFIDQMATGEGAGGRFVNKLKDIGDKFKDVGGFLKDHIDLIKTLVGLWVAYKTQALLAAAAGKAAAGWALLTAGRGRGAAGAAGVAGGVAGGAGAAAGGAAAGSKLGGKLGGPIGATILTAGAFTIGEQILKGPSGPDTGLLNKYADALERVVKAGDAQGMRALAGKLREAAAANKDLTKGENLHRFADALDQTAKSGGKDLSSLVGAFGKLALSSGGSLEQVRSDILRFAGTAGHSGDEVGQALDQAAGHFRDFRRTGSNNLKGIRDATADNMHYIKRVLGKDSAEGKDALARNYKLAADAVHQAMEDGKISTREGLAEIRRLMVKSLREYGLAPSQARDYLRNSGHGSGNEAAGGGHAGGGWIGQPGMVGQDVVPAMLAPGEAVLNRHQQAVIEGLLGNGFLDTLFSRVNRPHYMAKGGIVPVPGFPGEQAASSVIPTIEMIARRFGLVLTDAFGQGHKSPGHTRFGTAADFAGSDAAMDRAVRFLVGRGYLVGYDGRFGSQAWPGHGPSSVAGSNAHLHVELGGRGGAGVAVDPIRAPRTALSGLLGTVVQRSLDLTAAGATKALTAATAVPVAGGGAGGYGKGALAGLWRRAGGPGNISNLMAAIALAESGGRTRAHNPSGASGLWQILGQIVPGNIYDPMVNARNAVAKYRSQGLGAWEAYTNGSYRQYLAGGGFVRRTPGAQFAQRSGFAAPAGGFRLPKIKRLVKARLAEADDLTDHIESLEATYAVKDREYNLTEEEFVNQDGSLNQKAIDQRVKELGYLKYLRERILSLSVTLRAVLARARKNYRLIINRLQRAIRSSKGKARTAYRSQLGDYRDALGEVSGRITELDRTTIPMAQLDVKELGKEIGDVSGTQPTGDSSGGAGGSGSADADAIAAQAVARADRIAGDLRAATNVITAFSSAGDIGIGGSNAFMAVGNANQATGAQFAGGAARPNVAGGAAGGNVYNFNMPGHPEVLRAIGDSAVSGISLQSSVSSSVEKLGI